MSSLYRVGYSKYSGNPDVEYDDIIWYENIDYDCLSLKDAEDLNQVGYYYKSYGGSSSVRYDIVIDMHSKSDHRYYLALKSKLLEKIRDNKLNALIDGTNECL